MVDIRMITTKDEALEELITATRFLLKEACSCDLMYGIQCNIHDYEHHISELEKILRSGT